MRLPQYLRRLRKELEESKSAIPSCSRYLARVIYKLRLNSWNTKYSQNVTCVCKNILSVKHILFESPATTELFQKYGYDNGYLPVCLSVIICMGLSVMSISGVCLSVWI